MVSEMSTELIKRNIRFVSAMALSKRITRDLLQCNNYRVLVKRCICEHAAAAMMNEHHYETIPQTDDIKPFSDIPGPKGIYNIPFLGIALQFKPFTNYTPSDMPELLCNLRDKYGDIVKLKTGTSSMVYVFHPDYAKTVFQAQYKEHAKTQMKLPETFFKRNNIPKGVVLLQGEEWMKMRRSTQEKILRPAIVANYVPLIETVADDFVDQLRKTQMINDLHKELTNYTSESIGMLCFNKRLGYLDGTSDFDFYTNLQEMLTSFHQAFFLPIKSYKYFNTGIYKRFESSTLKIYRLAEREIKSQKQKLMKLEREGKLEEYLEKEPNFLHSLLSDHRVTDEQVSVIILDLIGAGIDSTANTIAFLLCDLAQNPDKQKKLYEEIKNVLGKSKKVKKSHLANLSYLKACVKETQRKRFPVFIGAQRILEHDLVLGGYRIPKQTAVAINNDAMSVDERFYPRPKEFIPERWLRSSDEDVTMGRNHPFGMKPFGFGQRSCLGQRFAENEIYICILKLIQNFEVLLPANVTDIPTVKRTFITPDAEIKLFLKERPEPVV
ncbi:CYP49A [Mytilus edulis]|uniref:CYP49A n=1 Tax=Mytilus edulis TaxID=6550 RepID=A0A8S3U2V6_MYTED|nr:CYP49A [Mytilus edulis]